jgi:RNA polymerase sigma factor (TIGR02999 family)
LHPAPGEITRLLRDSAKGNQESLSLVIPLVYEELRSKARSLMRQERDGHTLQTTALVNEAYMRLVEQRDQKWENRKHFLAIAALAMRRILVEHARARLAAKRGGKEETVPFDDELLPLSHKQSAMLVALDDALDRLQAIAERPAQVIHLRFFVGMTIEQTAKALGIDPRTVRRDWMFARAWLNHELRS